MTVRYQRPDFNTIVRSGACVTVAQPTVSTVVTATTTPQVALTHVTTTGTGIRRVRVVNLGSNTVGVLLYPNDQTFESTSGAMSFTSSVQVKSGSTLDFGDFGFQDHQYLVVLAATGTSAVNISAMDTP